MSPGYPHGFPPPAPPPELPELPEGHDPRPRWPAWFAPVGFLAAFAATLVAAIALGLIAALAGSDPGDQTPAVTLVGTFIQDGLLVATALWLASRVRRPRPWHFGLRRSRFWSTVGWAAVGMVAFYAFALAYGAILHPNGQQTVAKDLGADDSDLALVVAALLVV